MVEFKETALAIAFIVIVAFALLGALDYVVDSVKIFVAALRKYIERRNR